MGIPPSTVTSVLHECLDKAGFGVEEGGVQVRWINPHSAYLVFGNVQSALHAKTCSQIPIPVASANGAVPVLATIMTFEEYRQSKLAEDEGGHEQSI